MYNERYNSYPRIPEEFYEICLWAGNNNTIAQSFDFCRDFIKKCSKKLYYDQFIISGEYIVFKRGDSIYITNNDSLSLGIFNKAGYKEYKGNEFDDISPLEMDSKKIISCSYYDFFEEVQREEFPDSFVSAESFEYLLNSYCASKNIVLIEAWKNDPKFTELKSLSPTEVDYLLNDDFHSTFKNLVEKSEYLKCADWIRMRYPDINTEFDYYNLNELFSQKTFLEIKRNYSGFINEKFDQFLLFQEKIPYVFVPNNMLDKLHNSSFDKKEEVISEIKESLLNRDNSNSTSRNKR